MSKQPRKFEYILEDVADTSTIKAVTEGLNYWGQEGWELCGIEYGSFIFKREIHGEECP